MLNLTFGEQVKIVLNRKGMTIKQLAEEIEAATGKKMSRQNLTQRLSRDNFQEQDMRMIAEILGCSFQLSILATREAEEKASVIEEIPPTTEELHVLDMKKEHKAQRHMEAEKKEETVSKQQEHPSRPATPGKIWNTSPWKPSEADANRSRYAQPQPVRTRRDEPENRTLGEINPYTGMEYATNSVRTHPKRIGYVQVYSRKDHKWTDMTEWAFIGQEEQRKLEQGSKYVPPTFLN